MSDGIETWARFREETSAAPDRDFDGEPRFGALGWRACAHVAPAMVAAFSLVAGCG